MNKSEDNSSFTILELIRNFLHHKKTIFIITVISCIVSIIVYFFILDLIYISVASVKSSTSKGISGISIEGIPDIGGLDDLGLGGGKSARELATYQEILKSRRCLEELINKFGLMQRDDFRFMEDALKDFKENKLEIKEEKLAGVLYIGVYDKDPAFAKEMVEFLIAQLNKINIEVNVQDARNNREFIEKRYLLAKEDLIRSEDSLKSFQLIYGIAPDLQIKAAAQSAFALEAELKAEEVKLDVLKKILSSDQPEVKTQEAKVVSLRNKITEIQTSTDLSEFLRLGNSPQVAMEFLRLQRDMEIQTKILTFLLPVYEQAKIEERRETPTVIVLDNPVIAEKKTKPKRLTMVIVFTFAGFIVANLFFIVKQRWNRYMTSLKDDK